jgi:hypothetical protein
MRVPGLALMLSIVAFGDAAAGDVIPPQGQPIAQAKSSNVSCMPIGVTAAGDLVFPWECREVIERERGPVSMDLSTSTPSKEPGLGQPPQSQPAVAKAAAINDGAKSQPASQRAEPDHVATIPDTVAPPPSLAPAAAEPRAQVKRLAAGRRPFDPKAAPVRAPVQRAAPLPKRDTRLVPPS